MNHLNTLFIHSLNSKLILLIKASKRWLRFGALLLLLAPVQFAQAANGIASGEEVIGLQHLWADSATSKKIDYDLNIYYKIALKNITPDDLRIEALKTSQRDWLKYRNSQCSLTSWVYSRVVSDDEINENQICINQLNLQRIEFFKTITD